MMMPWDFHECMVDLVLQQGHASYSSCSTLKLGVNKVVPYLTFHLLGASAPRPLSRRCLPLEHLPRNVAAPVSGVICLLTDQEVPSLAARMLAQVVDSACFRER